MNIIIPLGGLGERFLKEKYTKPKPLIDVLGKSMVQQVIDSLVINKNDKIILIYNEFLDNYNFSSIMKNKYQNILLIKLIKQTNGAVETILHSLKYLEKYHSNLLDNKCVLIDGDTIYNTDILNIYRNEENNAVFCFNDDQENPIYSYVTIDNSNNIIDIKEKIKISNFANTGCYCFKNGVVLKQYCKKIIKENIRSNNEHYTSCLISEMLKDKNIFKALKIQTHDFDCIGTPTQLYKYVVKLQKQTFEKKRFCFDLDNTLVTLPEIHNDYTTVKPIFKNIMFLKFLKNLGHIIIIYTARKMRSCNGNVGEVIKNIAKITIDTLDKFDIPYDELYFGKPYANFYIDDLAINANDNLEKLSGFYYEFIKERDFNKITIVDNKYVSKCTTRLNGLDGEIYFYKNIPNALLDYFPKFIQCDADNKKYIVDKIEGINLSCIFVNENLNEEILLKLLCILKNIHDEHIDLITINKNNLNIYLNYCDKIETRFNTYDYSIFNNFMEIYEIIFNFLKDYENNKNGQIGVIHGDTVFSNIIINYENNFKFIDMRGKLGDKLTIYGDIFYDYAKIYQSLIGYDEIILNKYVSNNYRSNLINVFNNFIIKNFGVGYIEKIKYITSSLLFSAIPIHNNSHIYKFYDLVKNIIFE